MSYESVTIFSGYRNLVTYFLDCVSGRAAKDNGTHADALAYLSWAVSVQNHAHTRER